jgi:hypothetical protein
MRPGLGPKGQVLLAPSGTASMISWSSCAAYWAVCFQALGLGVGVHMITLTRN